jgi:hypothetical protein
MPGRATLLHALFALALIASALMARHSSAAPPVSFFATTTCDPANGIARLDFVEYPLPDLSDIAPDIPDEAVDVRDASWRCDLSSTWSVTAKFRLSDSPAGIATVWENGRKIERQMPIGHDTDYVVKSFAIDNAGAELCFWRGSTDRQFGCRSTARSQFPVAPDLYFTPGRAVGGPEPAPVILPMRWLEGFTDARCKIFAERLKANWQDEFDDLAAQIEWRELSFAKPDWVPTALAEFDIDNDGKLELVMRQVFDSHMVTGERFSIWPMDSWIRKASVIDVAAFISAMQADRSPDHRAHPGKYYDVADPFGRTEGHYSLKLLSIENRILIFARNDAESWSVLYGETAEWPTRSFFEVQPSSGNIIPVCTFAPPLRLGEQF